jgi:hypothetical protein
VVGVKHTLSLVLTAALVAAGLGTFAPEARRDHHHALEAGWHDHTHDGEPDSEGLIVVEDLLPVTSVGFHALPSHRRPPVCAPTGQFRTQVVYAHLAGKSNRIDSVRGQIRTIVQRTNHLLASEASAGGRRPALDLRVACTSTGAISVRTLRVSDATIAGLRAAAKSAGLSEQRTKYLVFGDYPSPKAGVAGIGVMLRDDSRSLANHHNGTTPLHALTYTPWWDSTTPLHELLHTMGAVQAGAPRSDGAGHCTDTSDVMCRPVGTSAPVRCRTTRVDCGADTYLNTAPGATSYLARHWNVGWEGNRFVRVEGRATPNDPPKLSISGNCTMVSCVYTAAASDFDGRVVSVRWDLGEGVTATGTEVTRIYGPFPSGATTFRVSATATDDKRGASTVVRDQRVSGLAPSALIDSSCSGFSCELSAARSTSNNRLALSYLWQIDGRTLNGVSHRLVLPAKGNYPVNLTVTDSAGWSTTVTGTVVVTDLVLIPGTPDS